MCDLFIIPAHDQLLYNLHLDRGKRMRREQAMRGRFISERKQVEYKKVEEVEERYQYLEDYYDD